MAILLWVAVILGLIVGVWPRAPVPRPALTAGACLAGLAGLTALSMTWASDDGRAFTEIVRVLTYLGLFVAVVLASGSGRPRPWLLGLAFGLTMVAALALGSRLEPSILPTSEVAETIREPEALASFPLGYWNAVAACAAMAIVLLGWLAASARSRWTRSIAAGLIPIPALDIFLTSSRGGLAALAAGVVVMVAIGPRRLTVAGGLGLGMLGAAVLVTRAATSPSFLAGADTAAARQEGHILLALTVLTVAVVAVLRLLSDSRLQGARLAARPSRGARRAAVAVAAVAAILAIIAASPAEWLSGFAAPSQAPSGGAELATSRLASSTGNGRFQYWEAGLSAFASRPLTGIGAGGYEAWWGEHGSLPATVRDAHSLFVETLAELGPLGLLLILAFLAIVAVTAIRTHRGGTDRAALGAALAVVAVGGVAAAQDWMWEIPAVFGPVIVGAALLTGPAFNPRAAGGRSRFGVGVATLLVGWVAILGGIAGILTELKLNASRDAVDRGDLAGAAQDAREAGALQPWAAAPYLQVAQIQQLRGDLPGAEQAMAEAIARAPDDWRVWFVAASLDAGTGDVQGALDATKRANRLRPNVPYAGDSGRS